MIWLATFCNGLLKIYKYTASLLAQSDTITEKYYQHNSQTPSHDAMTEAEPNQTTRIKHVQMCNSPLIMYVALHIECAGISRKMIRVSIASKVNNELNCFARFEVVPITPHHVQYDSCQITVIWDVTRVV